MEATACSKMLAAFHRSVQSQFWGLQSCVWIVSCVWCHVIIPVDETTDTTSVLALRLLWVSFGCHRPCLMLKLNVNVILTLTYWHVSFVQIFLWNQMLHGSGSVHCIMKVTFPVFCCHTLVAVALWDVQSDLCWIQVSTLAVLLTDMLDTSQHASCICDWYAGYKSAR
jgi:hypothetical protein